MPRHRLVSSSSRRGEALLEPGVLLRARGSRAAPPRPAPTWRRGAPGDLRRACAPAAPADRGCTSSWPCQSRAPGNSITLSSSSPAGASSARAPARRWLHANSGRSSGGRSSFSRLRRRATSRVRGGVSSCALLDATSSNQAFSRRGCGLRVWPDQSSPRAGGASA